MSVSLQEPSAPRISVATESEFARNLRRIIADRRPLKLIETGTHVGLGTTTIIASALKENGLAEADFQSIEVNPLFYLRACRNLRENGLAKYVTLNNGVSVPRGLLPTAEEIREEITLAKAVPDVYLDHADAKRVELYLNETGYESVQDDLLGSCLARFDHQPDFILLDSAGHMGWVEYQYVLQHIKGPCIIAFDDVRHIKHYRSLADLRDDPRFRIIAEGAEKFGYCIAEFDPAAAGGNVREWREGWVRRCLERALAPDHSAGLELPHEVAEAYAKWKETFSAGTLPADRNPIEALMRCYPMCGQYCIDLGRLLRAGGEIYAARQMFEQAVRLAPANAGGWRELARYYQDEVGNPSMAMALYRQAMRFARFKAEAGAVIEEKSGFHGWEGDFCWLDREAKFLVHADRLDFPAELEFTLTGADGWCYGGRPFPVTISNSTGAVATVRFSGNQYREKVVVPLINGAVESITIQSAVAFVPAQITANSRDARRLSVRISGLALRPKIGDGGLNAESLEKFLNVVTE